MITPAYMHARRHVTIFAGCLFNNYYADHMLINVLPRLTMIFPLESRQIIDRLCPYSHVIVFQLSNVNMLFGLCEINGLL